MDVDGHLVSGCTLSSNQLGICASRDEVASLIGHQASLAGPYMTSENPRFDRRSRAEVNVAWPLHRIYMGSVAPGPSKSSCDPMPE